MVTVASHMYLFTSLLSHATSTKHIPGQWHNSAFSSSATEMISQDGDIDDDDEKEQENHADDNISK